MDFTTLCEEIELKNSQDKIYEAMKRHEEMLYGNKADHKTKVYTMGKMQSILKDGPSNPQDERCIHARNVKIIKLDETIYISPRNLMASPPTRKMP